MYGEHMDDKNWIVVMYKRSWVVGAFGLEEG